MPPTIEQLEKDYGVEGDSPTSLVRKCHALRKKPIEEFTVEDLRIMIGQNLGIRYILPKALDVVEKDFLAGGDCYDGDLASAIFSIPDAYWSANPQHLARCLTAGQRFLKKVKEQWKVRSEKARELYGANLDGKEGNEDKIVDMVEKFIEKWGAR